MRKRTDFFRIEMLALKSLTRGDRYGYEISQEIARRTGNFFRLREGILYPSYTGWKTMATSAARRRIRLSVRSRCTIIWRRRAGRIWIHCTIITEDRSPVSISSWKKRSESAGTMFIIVLVFFRCMWNVHASFTKRCCPLFIFVEI